MNTWDRGDIDDDEYPRGRHVSSLTMAHATLWHYSRWVIRPHPLPVYQVNHTAYKQMWIAWDLCHISTWQVDINFMTAVDISSAFALTRMFTEILFAAQTLNVNWSTCVQRLCLEKVICDMSLSYSTLTVVPWYLQLDKEHYLHKNIWYMIYL